MKTTVKILLIALLPFILGSFTPAKDFTGVVVYNITYDMENMDPQMASYLPKTMKLSIKAPMSRSEIVMGMGTTISIFNSDTRSGVTVMDMMGQKIAVKVTSDDVAEEFDTAGDVVVTKTDETKEILGYTCHKATVKAPEMDEDMIVYYTEELSSGLENSDNPLFQDIDGMMLEFSMNQNGMKMHFTAVNIDKKKVPDTDFEIPEGYEEISKDEMKSRFGM